MIKQWKELFKAHILERGLNYYEMGAVNSLKRTDRGYTAEVEGSEAYQVEIELEDEYISDMTCDCPYAYDGNNCKHMAAVLYEVENGKADTTFKKDLINEKRAKEKELKKVCNNDEWIDYRERFLNLDDSSLLQFELFNKERLYDRLFEKIKEKDSIYILDKYERNLKKYLPEEVRDVYIDYVNEEMCNACSRNRYRDVIKYLKKISRYPDGKRLTQEISASWKREYNRRSAMIDELNRAGF